MTQHSQQNTQRGFHMYLAEIGKLLAAECYGDDVEIQGVSTDTRKIAPGQLFVALRGPNFDGHDFAQQAVDNGAVACLVEEPIEGLNCIVVDDTRVALGQLAAAWREKLDVKLVGITGSNGKTTVKEMLAAILSEEGEVLATHGNLNNDIGMPLTLLKMDVQHDYAVIEMGANHPGEIAYLTEIARPDVALITNAGMAHLEGFGSVEGVAHAKGEIYQGLGERGIAVINFDDDFSGYWKKLNQQRHILGFGTSSEADTSASARMDEGGQQLSLLTPKGDIEVSLSLLGKHNMLNALAAVAAAVAVDIPLASIKTGLEKLQPVSGRLQLKAGLKGSQIIDDTYNANPTSLYAALDVLGEFPGERFLALGDMGELGEETESLHGTAGVKARQHGVQRLYTLGSLAKNAANAFGDGSYAFANQDEMIEQIKSDLDCDVTLLVKGSRRMQMDNVVNACQPGYSREN